MKYSEQVRADFVRTFPTFQLSTRQQGLVGSIVRGDTELDSVDVSQFSSLALYVIEVAELDRLWSGYLCSDSSIESRVGFVLGLMSQYQRVLHDLYMFGLLSSAAQKSLKKSYGDYLLTASHLLSEMSMVIQSETGE